MADQLRPVAETLARIKAGTATRDEIGAAWLAHRRFVCKIANYYQSSLRTADEVDDLISESFFAFMDAARSFDPEKGSFLNWLAKFLHRTFQAYVAVNAGRSRRDQALLRAIRSFVSEFERDQGQRPSTLRIAEEVGISEQKVLEILTGEYTDSLDDPIGEDLTLSDEIPDDGCLEDQIIDRVIGAEVSKELYNAIQALPFNERSVIYLCYVRGLSDEHAAEFLGRSLREILNAKARAIRRLRSSRIRRRLSRLLPDRIGSLPYRGQLSRFMQYGSSSTEAAAIKSITLGEQENESN